MHPPFGFALFYLRGIAPKEVKSSDIYWGAVPWVVMQLLLVAILIFWPGLVTSFVPTPKASVPGNIELQLEQSAPKIDEPSSDIERLLKQQK
jgi:hypothetical protein